MTEKRRHEDRLIPKLLKLWPVILTMVTLIFTAATIKAKVEDHESRIARLEIAFNDLNLIKNNTDQILRKVNHMRERER